MRAPIFEDEELSISSDEEFLFAEEYSPSSEESDTAEQTDEEPEEEPGEEDFSTEDLE